MRFFTIFILALGLSGCGNGNDKICELVNEAGEYLDCATPTPVPNTPQPGPTATPVVVQPDRPVNPPNPIVEGIQSFSDGPGNAVSKPKSETDGNIVFLFHSRFTDLFDECCVELRSGGTRCIDKTSTPGCERQDADPARCFAGSTIYWTQRNPARMTLRPGVRAKQVEPNSLITCTDSNQLFTQEVRYRVRNPERRED